MNLNYDLLIAESSPPRREIINVGLVIWRDGVPEIFSDRSVGARLAALNPNYPRISVFKALLEGALSDQLLPYVQSGAVSLDAARMLVNVLISPMRSLPGGVMRVDDGDVQAQIERLLDALVRRPGLTVKSQRARSTQSQLDVQLRAWFRGAKIMGRGMEDLSKHRVVAQFPIAVDSDVYADFAYKNGALHVIETLDLRGADHVNSTMRNRAAFKSLTLDMARDVVTANGRRLGVVAASDYAAVKPALRLFERNADDVFSMDDPADTQRLADLIATGLHLHDGLRATDLILSADQGLLQ